MLSRKETDELVDGIWADVESVALTHADALDIFCAQWHEEEPLSCSRCGCEVNRAAGTRYSICPNCRKKESVTAKNLLRKARKFKAYLAVSLIREAGLHIGGARLARLTGIGGTTAYNLLRKFNAAICNQLPEEAVEISARFMELLIAKRSRTTPAEMHPIAEQELIEESLKEQAGQEERSSNAAAFETDSEQSAGSRDLSDATVALAIILSSLADRGIAMTGDQISELTGIDIGLVGGCLIRLEIDGKIRELPGGRYLLTGTSVLDKYLLSNPDIAHTIKISAKEFVDTIIKFHHRVSRRCLQWFYAPIWCEKDRERWNAGSIIRLCRNHPPIRYRDLLYAPAPPLIKVMLC